MDIINQPIKKCVGRPRKNTDEQNQIIKKESISRLRDSGYFKDYYQKNKEIVECEHCRKSVQKLALAKHQMSKYCQEIKTKTLEKNL
jgi:hypothetical protein